MSLLSENVILGNHGKVFGTNAKTENDLKKGKRIILTLNSVKDVLVENEKFLVELGHHTSALIRIEDKRQVDVSLGFYTIPKTLFEN